MLRAHERLNLTAGANYVLRAQLANGDGAWAEPDTVVSVHAQVYRRGSSTATYSGFLDVATVVLEAFVTNDDQWIDDTNDSRNKAGYNLKWIVPASAIPCADWYTVQITSTDADGCVTKLLFEGAAKGSFAAPESSSSSTSAGTGGTGAPSSSLSSSSSSSSSSLFEYGPF